MNNSSEVDKITCRYAEKLDFLTNTSIRFAQLSSPKETYNFIAETIAARIERSIVIVNSYDEQSRKVTTQAHAGLGRMAEKVIRVLGRDPVGMSFPLEDEVARNALKSGHLEAVDGGLHRLSFGMLPESVCSLLESILRIERIVGMGFSRNRTLFGTGMIILRRDYPVESDQLIHTFMTQTTVYMERIQHENDKETLQKNLAKSQKMDAVGTLAGGIAHDFNNLLTVIQGHAQIALRRIEDNSEIERDLNNIFEASKRAANLTRQLLQFSRSQSTEHVEGDLNEIITAMSDMISSTIPENILFQMDLDSSLWAFKCDRTNIEQLLLNLVFNSRDAMESGGRLTIATRNVVLKPGRIHQNPLDQSGEFIVLSVCDTGTGINQDVRERIFEPFFTTKEVGKGSGLGLAVAYSITKDHEGWLTVDSEVGKGTTIKAYFPAQRKLDEKIREQTVESFISMGGDESILLVEDDDDVRELLHTVLEEQNYCVYSAATAEDAIDIFRRKSGQLNLIFSDFVLPDSPACDMIRTMNAFKSGFSVLLGSGYSEQKLKLGDIALKDYAFIQKPYMIDELLTVIQNLLLETSDQRK